VKPLVEGLSYLQEKAPEWRLIINESVEVNF